MFTSTGTYWHCICDICHVSLFDELGGYYDNMHRALATANITRHRINVDFPIEDICRC